MALALTVITVLLGLLGIGLSVEHLLDANPYNPGFTRHPLVIRSHVVLGAVFLALTSLQFSGTLRQRRPRLHRAVGRITVAAGLVAGGTALLITIWFPYSGPAAIAVVAPFAGFFVASLARGLWLARQRRFQAHREWMIRALSIGTSIATMRLIFVPAMLLIGDYEDESLARWLSLTCFGAAFVLHAAVAEAWIHATRAAGQPGPLLTAASPLASARGGN
ncbi:MAG TPA: DUF2306 domain-containing protein [Myxococcota bacterium]|nr:DUF2306 domain-containing protein [Myxococcota bacterium]